MAITMTISVESNTEARAVASHYAAQGLRAVFDENDAGDTQLVELHNDASQARVVIGGTVTVRLAVAQLHSRYPDADIVFDEDTDGNIVAVEAA